MTIKELREKTGLSQSQFAEEFNIPLKNIQNWEQGISLPKPYLIDMIKEMLILKGFLKHD